MKKDKQNCPPCRKTSIGGQALLEGVMMRGPERYALSVRRPNGEIYFEVHENTKKQRPKICRWPFIRGIFGFVDSLTLGYKCLMRSADIFAEEETKAEKKKEENAEKTSDTPSSVTKEASFTVADNDVPTALENKAENENSEPPKSALGKGTMTVIGILAAVLGIAIALGLFVWFPIFLFSKLSSVLPQRIAESRLARSAFEGVIKIVLF